MDDYLRLYGLIAIFAVVALVVPVSMMMISWLASKVRIRPQKPSPVKSDVYECGMETIGGRWVQFNFRYYTYALLFVIFDVQVIFVYPWAVRMNPDGLIRTCGDDGLHVSFTAGLDICMAKARP